MLFKQKYINFFNRGVSFFCFNGCYFFALSCILDDFSYKFENEEDYKRKCKLQKSLKDTFELINRQSLYLDKEKNKLILQMIGDQTSFTAELAQLETTILTLSQYQDINQSHEVAEILRKIHKRMQDAHQKAKKFANRERLMTLNETNYNFLAQLSKEYEPYYNLWTTSDNWFKNHQLWLTQLWGELNVSDIEEKMIMYIMTKNKAIRFFREKEIPAILKIGKSVKGDLDRYKPFVSLALALRKDGMKDKHWE